MSLKEFKEKIQNNDFVEWEEVYTNVYYGTEKSEIQELNRNEQNIVFDIDVVGGLNIKKQFPNTSISIFIKPPNLNELKNRLIKRATESKQSIRLRLDKASKELDFSDKYDFIVVNDNLESAVQQAEKIIHQFITKK